MEDELKPLPNPGEDIEVTGYLASGRRADVYTALYGGRRAVAKIYKPEFIEKYRRRFGRDIAVFEYERNYAFYSNNTLRPYCSEPLHYISDNDGVCTFVQEYIEGDTVKRFAEKTGGLPEEIIEAGYLIVNEAAKIGLHDLDITPSNVLIVADEQRWKPMMCDFNMMPQHKFPSNPFLMISFLLGFRRRSHRDYANLKRWKKLTAH